MKFSVFVKVLKKTHAFPFLGAFLIVYVVGSLLLWIFDPEITSMQDGFWLAFNIVTSIGLGDYTVKTLIARLAAVILGLYGALIVAFIPSLVVSFYLEKTRTLHQVLYQKYHRELEHASSLTSQQLKDISDMIHRENQLFKSRPPKDRQQGSISLQAVELFSLIFRQTHLGSFVLGFGIIFVVCAVLIYIFDPSITSLADAFWFGFMVVTTIGFGDFTVVHWSSRLVTMFLGVYGIFMLDFATGVMASYFLEVVHYGGRESLSEMLWKFEHLDLLTPAELRKLEVEITNNRPENP